VRAYGGAGRIGGGWLFDHFAAARVGVGAEETRN
jgi:hypothetical protein